MLPFTESGLLAERGIRSKTGHLVMRAHTSNMLSNPFYYGHFRYAGELYEGAHQPFITKALFDQVDAVLTRRWRYSPSENKDEPKAFLGLLHCAECGSAITAEIQKGHTYDRCIKKNKMQRCAQPYIREEALDGEISALLNPFMLRADWVEEMLQRVKKEKKHSAQSAAQLVEHKRAEIESINLRLQRLLDSFLDELIDRETFTAQKAKLMSQKKHWKSRKRLMQPGEPIGSNRSKSGF